MVGKHWLRARVALLPMEPPRPSRLPVARPTGAHGLIFSLIRMLLPRARDTEPVAPMTTLVVAANGLLVPAHGKMLVLLATEVMQDMVVSVVMPMRVPTVMVTRPLTLTPVVIRIKLEEESLAGTLTLLLRATAAGVQLRNLTLRLMLTLTEVKSTELMAVAGKQPAVMDTQAPTPLDVVMVDGAQLLRVQLMPSLAKKVSRSAKRMVARPRTSTVMHTVLPMLALVVTVAPTLMAVVLVLPAMLPTLADKVLPCVSQPPVEIDVQKLVEVAMLVNTREQLAMQVRVMVPEAAEPLALVVPATLVHALLAFAETFQTSVLTAVELVHLVVVVVPMVAHVAMAHILAALVAMAVDLLATAALVAMAVLLASVVITAATATAVVAATAAMVMAIELVIMVKKVITGDPFEVIKATAKERFYPCYGLFKKKLLLFIYGLKCDFCLSA